MSDPITFLQEVKVASPCSADWREMKGDARKRFCSQCRLNVYNFTEMTAGEAAELIRNSEGRVCGRFYRRRDGTMITRDCPAGVRAGSQRKASAVLAVLGLLAAIGLAATRPFQPNPGQNSGDRVSDRLIDDARSAPVVGPLVNVLCPATEIMGKVPVPTYSPSATPSSAASPSGSKP